MTMKFETTCVLCGDGAAINQMVETSRDISRRTFLRHVNMDSFREIENDLGYARTARDGLTMAKDWHVTYHKSTWRGRQCVFFVWSAIEYIFT